MNRKSFAKGIIGIGMILALGVCVLPSFFVVEKKNSISAEIPAEIKPDVMSVNLGITGLNVPNAATSAGDEWGAGTGDYVFFGKYMQSNAILKTPIKWRVLTVQGSSDESMVDSVLLMSDSILDVVRYNESNMIKPGRDEGNNYGKSGELPKPDGLPDKDSEGSATVVKNVNEGHDYAKSDIRKWLKNDFIKTAFEDSELAVINATVRKNNEELEDMNFGLDKDKVFIMSKNEVQSSIYGFYTGGVENTMNLSRKLELTQYVKDKGTMENKSVWQLRTFSKLQNDVQSYIYDGKKYVSVMNLKYSGVVPAINLNRSSIQYISKYSYNKTSGLKLTTNEESNKNWNIALLGKEGFSANIPDYEMNIVAPGGDISIKVSEVPKKNHAYNQISAMIVNDKGTVVAYGKVSDKVEEGTIEVDIPTGLVEDMYTLKLFAEEVNSVETAGAVDYVSNMAEMVIIVEEDNTVKDIIAEEKEAHHDMNVKLYDNNRYASGGSGKALTESGLSVTNWAYDKSKFLLVDLQTHVSENVHTIRIECSKEMYFVGDVTNVPTGCSGVEFIKSNEPMSTNSGATKYGLEAKSGTLVYYLKPNVSRVSIPVEVRYDSTFWDRQNYSEIAEPGTELLKVSLNYEKKKGVYLPEGVLKMAKLTGITASTASNKRIGYNIYDNGRFIDTNPKAKDCIIYLMTSNQAKEYQYFKEGIFEINMPYWTDNYGTRQYLKYDAENIVHHKAIFGGGLNYEIVEKRTDGFKIRIKNMHYFTGHFVFKIPFIAPNGLRTNETKLLFSGGSYTLKGISNASKSVTSFTYNLSAEYFSVKDVEDVSLFTDGNVYVGKTGNFDSVSHLGGVFIQNRGTLDSVSKTINMQFANKLLVTTYNAPANIVDEYIEFTYRLKDERGSNVSIGGKSSWSIKIKNPYYKYEASKHNTYVEFSRQDLPEEHRKYFFSQITYTISTIAGSTKQYNQVALMGYNCGGNFFGYLASNAANGSSNASKLTLTSRAGSGIATISSTSNTIVTTSFTSAYGVDSCKFSKEVIEAGDSVGISGSVFAVNCSYGNVTIINGIRLGLYLPTGVSVDKDSIEMASSTGIKLKATGVTSKKINANYNMWVITIDPNFKIGYFTERLEAISNGERLNYKMTLKTEKNMDLTTLFTDEVMYASAGYMENKAIGSYAWCATTDAYDLNGNGSRSDLVTKVPPENSEKCIINVRSPKIEAVDSIKVEGKGTVDKKFATIKANSDIVVYSIDIEGDANSTNNKCEYYIPVPKKTSGKDDKLVIGSRSDAFDFNLIESVAMNTNANVEVLYTTKTGLDYASASADTGLTWYTKVQLEQGNISYKDITMIKLVMATGNEKKALNASVKLRMNYGGTGYVDEVGLKNMWKTYGEYEFYTNARKVAGVVASEGCSARIGYVDPDMEEITMVGVPSKDTSKVNEVKNYFPQNPEQKIYNMDMYRKKQTYTIKDIQLHNIVLQTKAYMTENQEKLSEKEANNNFAFTLKMEDGEEVNIAGGEGKMIGSNTDGSVPRIDINMYYGSAFNDSLTERYMIVTLESDLGLIIRTKVNVTFEDKNELTIHNGENAYRSAQNRILKIFYKYEVQDRIVINEPIEFSVEKSNPSAESEFVLSFGELFKDSNKFVNARYIKLYDDKGNEIKAQNNIYMIKGDIKYKLYITEEFIMKHMNGSKMLYLISRVGTNETYQPVSLVKRRTFVEH